MGKLTDLISDRVAKRIPTGQWPHFASSLTPPQNRNRPITGG
jgi:hypothetical protein